MEDGKTLYEIKTSDDLGRYLVAKQDIDAQTLIICEKPLVSGPADDDTSSETGEIPMCLGCCRRMTKNSQGRCSKCTWPVCGLDCENTENHAANECQVFVRNSVNYPCRHTWPVINKSILVLRTLLLKNKYPSLWHEVILKLEHHTPIRQTKPSCMKADRMLVENLNDFLHGCGYEMNEDIVRISGIINVNAFSSIKTDFHGSCVRIVQCIYPNASLMAHSCIPNCAWSIDDGSNDKICIRSAVPIKQGQMISISYNIPEMVSGTLHRLISIEDVAHFACKCVRCSDPTEGNTFVSAIKCFHCEANYMLPEESTNPESLWRCRGCDCVQPVTKIVLFLNCIEESYDEIKRLDLPREREIKKLELFVKLHEGLLHKNHYVLQEIRMRIINLQVHSLEYLNETDLQRFITHCTIMLAIADKLMPGFSKTRALLQFFLSQGLIRAVAIKQSNPEEEHVTLRKFYKEIHFLQTRSLMYFNGNNHPRNNGLTTVASEISSCIKRQLRSCENYLDCVDDLKQK